MTLPSAEAVQAWTAAICSADERVIMAAVALQLAYLEARREVEAEERISASLSNELEQSRTEARAARQGMLKYAAQAGELATEVAALTARVGELETALSWAHVPIPPQTISVKEVSR